MLRILLGLVVLIFSMSFLSCLPQQDSGLKALPEGDSVGNPYDPMASSNSGMGMAYNTHYNNVQKSQNSNDPMNEVDAHIRLLFLIKQGDLLGGCSPEQKKAFTESYEKELMEILLLRAQITRSKLRIMNDALEAQLKEPSMNVLNGNCVIKLPTNYEPGSVPSNQSTVPGQKTVPDPQPVLLNKPDAP